MIRRGLSLLRVLWQAVYQRLYLAFREITAGPFTSFIVLCAIVVSVCSASIFDIIGVNLGNYIGKRFAASIPPDMVQVSPRPAPASLFGAAAPARGGVIDDRVLARLRALPGVTAVYPVMPVTVPMQSRIALLGHSYRTDLLALGLPYDLVRNDIRENILRRVWKNPPLADEDAARALPVLVPRNILAAYNEGMADQNGLPRLTEEKVTGMAFTLVLGRSSLKSLDTFITRPAVVCGFTDALPVMALFLPLPAVDYYNKKFHGEGYRRSYVHVFLRIRNHASMVASLALLKKTGLVVEQGKSVSQQILQLQERVNGVLTALKYLILALSMTAVAFSTGIATMGRTEYYKILRILGSSKIFIAGTIIIKYMLIGFTGSYGSMKLISLLAGRMQEMLHFTGLAVTVSIPAGMAHLVILYGTLVPVLATLPAVLRLYFIGLNRD